MSFNIAVLAAPTQVGPANNSTIQAGGGYDMPTFSWTAVPGVNRYWLNVVDASNNNAVVINNNNVSGTSFTLSTSQALTPGHSYTWYIAAVSTNGTAYTFSGAQTFSLAALAAADAEWAQRNHQPPAAPPPLAGTRSLGPRTITSTCSTRPRTRRSSTTTMSLARRPPRR